MSPYSISWGVYGPIRVLLATGSRGHLPEDLLDGAREAFSDARYFEVKVKLHPMRYNPAGRFLSRLREEWRHWIHVDRPYWRWLGVSADGRMPAHWTFLRSRGWRDGSYRDHLRWADVLIYDGTSLYGDAKLWQIPVIHWKGRKQFWVYNPEAIEAQARKEAPQSIEVLDPLALRYAAYALGRKRAEARGLQTWHRDRDAMVVHEGKRYDFC